MAIDPPSQETSILMYSLENISVTYGEHTLLHALTLDFHPAELCVVAGPNGAGKSTLLKSLDGEIPVTTGVIKFNQKPLSHWQKKHLAKLRAVLPQHSNLDFPFTVQDVVKMGRTPHDTLDSTNREILNEVMHLCDCDSLKERPFPYLSGGEQQRVQIARVFAQIWDQQPGYQQFLLLDEPIAGLDLSHQYALLNSLNHLAVSKNIGVICVLHNLNLAAQFADRCIILDQGRLVADGMPIDVFTEETLSNVFDLNIMIQPHPEKPQIPLIIPRI